MSVAVTLNGHARTRSWVVMLLRAEHRGDADKVRAALGRIGAVCQFDTTAGFPEDDRGRRLANELAAVLERELPTQAVRTVVS